MSGWKKVNTGDTKAWDYKTQKEVSGVYVQKKENVGPNGSNMYILELENGTQIAVWGSAVIDNNMSGILQGSEVKIVYNGLTNNPKTGRSFHNFDFFTKEPVNSVTEPKVAVEEEINNDDLPF